MLRAVLKGSVLALGLVGLLTGCGGDDAKINAILPAEYEVTVSNLTNFQPLSPIGITLDEDASFFSIGQSASLELETMAESGDNSGLLALASTSVSSDGVLLPGTSVVLHISKDAGVFTFSAFSMLVNTNDAFTGVNAYEVGNLRVGESVTLNTNAYDAGTEANSEAAGTIPGPADGGEGFNATRDDADVVRMHTGVLTKDDGLASSVLTEQAKFDNAVMRVSIKRIN